jgi:DsbC/DsbD-like thiol-disulfide interchange protein
LRVVPRQKDKPVTLHAKIDYAICAKLCVPVEARAQLALSGDTANENGGLSAAEARVPQPVSAAQAGLSVRRTNEDKGKPLVFVDLAAAGHQPVEIFVEGPTADWALPIPKPAPGAPPGRRQFAFELDGLPPGFDPKAPVDLTFTIVSGGHASEVKTRLD